VHDWHVRHIEGDEQNTHPKSFEDPFYFGVSSGFTFFPPQVLASDLLKDAIDHFETPDIFNTDKGS